MNDSEKYIKQCTQIPRVKFNNNAPAQYDDVNPQHMANRNRLNAAHRAYIAANFITAEVQGLTDNFYDFITTDIRLTDVTTNNVTNFDSKKTDDFKEVLLAYYEYIPVGAKIKAMGSTWIVQNPANLSSPNATAIVARCNATYNDYDFYGNIVTEPIVIQKTQMLDSNPETPQNLVLMDGYFNIICQKNANTQNLGENSRLILGSKAYEIEGYSDFIQEFTSDRSSTKLSTFRATVKEPTIYDDMVNGISDGMNASFSEQITGISSLIVGQSGALNAEFLVNGEVTQGTAEYPLNWQWAVADESIATIDGTGIVTGIAEGSTTATATLTENPNITASVGISVLSAVNPYIEINNPNISSIRQYDKATFTATYYENNEPTSNVVTWSLSGAGKRSYYAEVDGNEITIQCVSPATSALVIQAEYNGVAETKNIQLEGY